MGYGSGAFLLVVGLVLALAVTDQVSGVDLTMVGWIMDAVDPDPDQFPNPNG